jgi:uncharacterized protein
VIGARLLYGLPYYRAKMVHRRMGETIHFQSIRSDNAVRFSASYKPIGPVFYPEKGTFEHWVAERYCLYSLKGKSTVCVEVHHRAWPLQIAHLEIQDSNVLEAAGIDVQEAAPVCHFSSGVEVVSYSPIRANQSLEPTALARTPSACAEAAPAKAVAHH